MTFISLGNTLENIFLGARKKNKWLMAARMVGRQLRMKQEIFASSLNSSREKVRSPTLESFKIN